MMNNLPAHLGINDKTQDHIDALSDRLDAANKHVQELEDELKAIEARHETERKRIHKLLYG